MLPYLIVLVLDLWLVLTILGQLPAFQAAKGRWNKLGLIPTWQLFTSPLVRRNVRLCWRDERAGGGFGDWVEVKLYCRPGLWRAFWHPQRRAGKMLLDVCIMLISQKLSRRLSSAEIRQTTPYQVLLQLTRRARGPGLTRPFQYGILLEAGGGRDTAGAAFLSEVESP